MEAVAPDLGLGRAEIIAKDQPQYIPLPAELVAGPKGAVVLTRWTFTSEERARIAAGMDLYLSVLTFDNPLQPLLPSVGFEEQVAYLNR